MRLRILGLVVLLGGASSTAFASPIVSVSPSASTVQQFDNFQIDVAIADARDLVAYEFDLTFDPAVLTATDVTEGPFLSSGGGTTIFIPGDFTTTPGLISFTAASLLGGQTPGVDGDGVLAHIAFTATAAGSSPLTLANPFFLALLRDDQGELVIDPDTGDFVVNPDPVVLDLAGGSVTVEAAAANPEVPEPATLILIGTGMAAALRRRARTSC